jgi:hypothetical protein
VSIRTAGLPGGALRLLALWAVLFAVYAAGAGVDPRTGDEVTHLRIASGLADDGELVRAPVGAGFGLLVAPAEAVGGARAVELFLAAIAALGFVLGALLARRIVPEPYASAGAGLAGLSPPAIAHATAIYPELTAGTLLAGAAVCAVSARDEPRAAPVLGGAAMLAALPWLGVLYAVPGLPVAVALYLWCRSGRRPLLGLIAAELVGASLVVFATVNERLYGGPTPWSASPAGETATGASSALDYLERLPRLTGLWLERDYVLLRWAPVLALAWFAAWLLWRSRREHLARVVPARATAEAAAGLALAVCAGQLLVAALLVPAVSADWFPARHLAPALPVAAALVAWGLRHAPRAGAVLGAISLATSAWLLIARDPWSPPTTSVPWGPFEVAVPFLAAAALVVAAARAMRSDPVSRRR